jgi:hypothetical protein
MKKQKKNKILVKVMKMRYLHKLDNLFSHLMENFKVLKW